MWLFYGITLNVTVESQLFLYYASNETNLNLNTKQSEIQFAWGFKLPISHIKGMETWVLLSSPTFL